VMKLRRCICAGRLVELIDSSCPRLGLDDSHAACDEPLVYLLPGTRSVPLPAGDRLRRHCDSVQLALMNSAHELRQVGSGVAKL